jgi:magnesium transporter
MTCETLARCASFACYAFEYGLTPQQLLHLHPLTLEDILQQESGEKLELFPKLGYYFIVFRAIESRSARDRLRRLLNPLRETAKLDDEGIIGEVMVYLVVFREGVCSVSGTDGFAENRI